jgi:hypothetical protein
VHANRIARNQMHYSCLFLSLSLSLSLFLTRISDEYYKFQFTRAHKDRRSRSKHGCSSRQLRLESPLHYKNGCETSATSRVPCSPRNKRQGSFAFTATPMKSFPEFGPARNEGWTERPSFSEGGRRAVGSAGNAFPR